MNTERRILDMLAGWNVYIQNCIDNHKKGKLPSKKEYLKEQEIICELYQEAAQFFDKDSNPSDKEVEKFISDKIISFIIKGT